jgi:general secretion pathway protein F
MSSASLTHDQLAALSEELAALSRAGVPLDAGLRALAVDLPGRVGQVADQVSQRLARGEPLDQAVAEQLGSTLPPAYRTVIAAGQRAGRLPAALEEIANTTRRLAELRRSIGLSLIYPLAVLAVAWSLFLFVLSRIVPVMADALIAFDIRGEPLKEAARRLNETAPIWSTLIPLAFAAWLAIAWYRSGRVARGVELPGWFSFGAVGTMQRMQRAARLASLAELLALLVRNQVPLADAVELASGAVGSRRLAEAGQVLAQRLRRGERIEKAPPGFPPVLAWVVCSPSGGQELDRALSRTARVYREEFYRRGQWLTLYVPLVLTALGGGLIVAVYGLVTLGPWIAIMHRLSLAY